MSFHACRALINHEGTREENKERAARIDAAFPNCMCQVHSVSEHSDGTVKGDEVLLRILVAPQHMRGSGGPKQACLTDAETSGLSLLRKEQATNADVRSVAEGLVTRARAIQPKKAGVFGVLELKCDTIRDFIATDESNSCYCVYDTAQSELKCHTEAFQRVYDTDGETRSLRRTELFRLIFMNFIHVRDFRNGLLLDLAPQN